MSGATCTTCFTLNPPAAPACVRCNSPLAPAEPARGLAAAPKAEPGSSRARAAEEQPPGYGLDGPPEPEPEPERPAGPPEGLGKRLAVVGTALVLGVLIVGGAAMWLSRGRYLDEVAVEKTIAGQLAQRGDGPVTVDCPPLKVAPGRSTACTATDGAGGRRTLTVTVLDDAGRYRWELAR